MDRRKDEGKRH
jgi:hypothetical protein